MKSENSEKSVSCAERVLAALMLAAILAGWFSFVFVSYDEDYGWHFTWNEEN